jgi:hypothetical protein
MMLDTRWIGNELYMTDSDGKHWIECEECGGTGDIQYQHCNDCDDDDCELCNGERDCSDCRGEGVVECDGCEHCEAEEEEAA